MLNGPLALGIGLKGVTGHEKLLIKGYLGCSCEIAYKRHRWFKQASMAWQLLPSMKILPDWFEYQCTDMTS